MPKKITRGLGRAALLLVAVGAAYQLTVLASGLRQALAVDYGRADDAAGMLPTPEADLELAEEKGEAKAVLAGGCFWCTEAVFEEVPGVTNVVSGYAGGTEETANYQAVLTGDTGHAEAVEVTYDPSVLTYGHVLKLFFATHNPTTKDRQGPDYGPQYRSAVFYANAEQKRIAEAYIAQLEEAEVFRNPIVTTVEALEPGFFEAESYHQDYAEKNPNNPYIRAWAEPKVRKIGLLLTEKEAE